MCTSLTSSLITSLSKSCSSKATQTSSESKPPNPATRAMALSNSRRNLRSLSSFSPSGTSSTTSSYSCLCSIRRTTHLRLCHRLMKTSGTPSVTSLTHTFSQLARSASDALKCCPRLKQMALAQMSNSESLHAIHLGSKTSSRW